MDRIELAQRIIDLNPWEARDTGATPETVADDIKNHADDVISYLLDILEDLYARGQM